MKRKSKMSPLAKLGEKLANPRSKLHPRNRAAEHDAAYALHNLHNLPNTHGGTPGPWCDLEFSEQSAIVIGRRADNVHHEDDVIAHVFDPKDVAIVCAAPEMLAAIRIALYDLEAAAARHPGWRPRSLTSLRSIVARIGWSSPTRPTA